MVETKGSCLCGQFRIEIDGKPLFMGHCCCTDCQKSTGTGHVNGAFFREDDVRISGEYKTISVKAESGNEISRHFCPECGSWMFTSSSGRPGIRGVPVGVLEDQNWFSPQIAIFTRSRQPWDLLDENIPHFEGPPPPPSATTQED